MVPKHVPSPVVSYIQGTPWGEYAHRLYSSGVTFAQTGFYASLQRMPDNMPASVKQVFSVAWHNFRLLDQTFGILNLGLLASSSIELSRSFAKRFSDFRGIGLWSPIFSIGLCISSYYLGKSFTPYLEASSKADSQLVTQGILLAKLALGVALVALGQGSVFSILNLLGTGYSLYKNRQIVTARYEYKVDFPKRVDKRTELVCKLFQLREFDSQDRAPIEQLVKELFPLYETLVPSEWQSLPTRNIQEVDLRSKLEWLFTCLTSGLEETDPLRDQYQALLLNLNSLYSTSTVGPEVKQVKAASTILLIPSGWSSPEETCPICCEQENFPYLVCGSAHKICQDCVEAYYRSQLEQIPTKRSFRANLHLQYGRYTSSSTYLVKIHENDLPRCPMRCVCHPNQSYEVSIQDHNHFIQETELQIEGENRDSSSQKIFEVSSVIYDAAHTILSTLQKYPEFLETAFKIQEWLVLFELFSLWGMFYLRDLKSSRTQNEGQVLGGISLFGFSTAYFAYRFFLPKTDLNQFINLGDSSSHGIKKLEMKWAAPSFYLFMLFVKATRLLYSSFFYARAQYRKINLASLFLQGVSLFNFAQLKWIEAVSVLDSFQSSIGDVYTRSYYLVPSNCINTQNHVASVVSKILHFSSNLFKGSSWRLWRLVRYQNGAPVNTEYFYRVLLQNPKKVIFCDCDLPILIESYSAKVGGNFGMRVEFQNWL